MLHPEDEEELAQLRRTLAGHRVVKGWNQRQAGEHAGLRNETISGIERGQRRFMRLAFICKYAQATGLVVHAHLEDLDFTSAEIQTYEQISYAAPHNGQWLEALLLSILAQARKDLGIPADLMAKKFGMSVKLFEQWESAFEAPDLHRLMVYARELGGRLRVTVLAQ